MELHTYPSSDLMGPSFFPWSSYEVHTARPSKGNQQPNDELRMKADELDKLFAAPKLRPHGDQTASSQMPQGNWVMEGSSNSMEFDANLVLQMIDNQNYFHNMMQKLGNLSQPENCRGKFYDRYIIKRDAKLREEWRSKRVQKEASMKDMQDRLEQIRAKMMARLEGSADRKELALQDRRHAERLRSSGVYSRMPSKEQQTNEFIQSEEEEDIQEFSEEVQYVQDKFYNDALFSDSSSTSSDSKKLVSTRSMSSSATQIITRPIPRPPIKSINSQSQHTVESLQCEEEDLQKSYEQVQYSRNKSYNGRMYTDGSYRSMDSNKLLTSRSVSSSATRTSIAPIPRPSGKVTSSGHIRRRSQPEILFAQSISNSGDFRKENKRPSNRISKVTTPAESRNLARSKSTSTRKNSFQVDKPQRSHSLRKSTASPGELKNLSPLSHNSATLAPSTFSKEHSEQTVFSKMQRSGESKAFLRKGSGIGPGAGAGLAKQKASMASEILIDGEVYESVVDRYEESPDHIINDKDEEFERAPTSGRDIYISADSDSEDPTSSQGSRESSDHLSENSHVLRSPSQVDINLDAIPLSFNSPARNVQEPPGESHGSWNSHICHSFSYICTDHASMDSPTSSSASWNSHPLNQMRNADAIRIRKKWGSAQNPFSVSNASRQSPKDASKGIKRLLTFGKKSRGAESKVNDWVSASTVSEGDDDAEDGNYGINQSSENPRMSRLVGYTLPANDGSNVTNIFSEQVLSSPGSIQTHANFKLKEDYQSGSPRKAPRSFFSLPSFRNRGSESNLR